MCVVWCVVCNVCGVLCVVCVVCGKPGGVYGMCGWCDVSSVWSVFIVCGVRGEYGVCVWGAACVVCGLCVVYGVCVGVCMMCVWYGVYVYVWCVVCVYVSHKICGDCLLGFPWQTAQEAAGGGMVSWDRGGSSDCRRRHFLRPGKPGCVGEAILGKAQLLTTLGGCRFTSWPILAGRRASQQSGV